MPFAVSLTQPQDWSFPVPVAFGPGRLQEIGAICRKAGTTRPLIVTDRGSAELPFIGALRGHLETAGLSHATFAGISPNPRDDEIGEGAASWRAGGHDGVIAIGGGSGMDGGKSVALTATSGFDLWDFEFERDPPVMSGGPAFPPLICIPTTAGTGAETESTAMVTETARAMKLCVWHPELKPACALLDPELTLDLPAHLTAWTGIDALVHAVEAYCVPGFHPLCDGAALEALRLIHRWLPVACADPHNIEARSGMLAGSCLAGVAFLKGLGLVHAISHMVGAEYDTHHGLTNAVLLPQVLRFNAPAIAERVPPMAQAMNLPGTGFDFFYAAVCKMLDDLAIPRRLAGLGVEPEACDRLAAKAVLDSAAATNPRPADTGEVSGILRAALENGR